MVSVGRAKVPVQSDRVWRRVLEEAVHELHLEAGGNELLSGLLGEEWVVQPEHIMDAKGEK